MIRTPEEHERIAADWAAIMSTPQGRACAAYLRSITVNVTNGPAVSDAALRHHAGMCNLAAIIEQWVNHGRKRPEPEQRPAGRKRKPAAGG